MARPRSKITAVCQNDFCSYFLKEKGKDIIKKGKNKAKHMRYFCFNCKSYFVETKGTPLYNKKLKERKIKAICKELVEKKGIRAVSRTMHINKNTICDLLDDLAKHAIKMTTYLVHDLGLNAYEVDELWTLIKKNKKNLDPKTINSLNQAKLLLQHA